MPIPPTHTPTGFRDDAGNGMRLRRRLTAFVMLSLAAHAFVLGEFRSWHAARAELALGLPVLDVQLQDQASEPSAPTTALKTPIRPKPTAAKSASSVATKTPQTPEASPPTAAPGANADTARAEPPATAMTEAGLRNQLLGELQTHLSRYLTYPPLARQRGWEGTVWLGLRIEPNGQLERLRIERSSGYAILDDSALHSLSRVGRIAEASAWLKGRGLEMQLPVMYRLVEN